MTVETAAHSVTDSRTDLVAVVMDTSPPSQRSNSLSLRWSRQRQLPFTGETLKRAGNEVPEEECAWKSQRIRRKSSASGASISSSWNQKTPVRSYYHQSIHGPLASIDAAQESAHSLRERTAELATRAMSVATSVRSSGSSPRQSSSSCPDPDLNTDSLVKGDRELDSSLPRDLKDVTRPEVIDEVSEPLSSNSTPPSRTSPGTSILSDLLRESSPSRGEGKNIVERNCSEHDLKLASADSLITRDTSAFPPSERTALLPSEPTLELSIHRSHNTSADLEGQITRESRSAAVLEKFVRMSTGYAFVFMRTVTNPKSRSPAIVWQHVFAESARYVPAIFLGSLLNILDALSYGLILFPIGEPLFSNLGPDGMSMFYVSTIIAQITYSTISIFRCSIGSEMIEVVPFFHKMAHIILSTVGQSNPKSVLATTVVAFSASSVLTGVVFLLMGAFKLGSLTGFFPRHILLGCIGGVGWFLIATGVEVSARLDGNLEYTRAVLQKLFQADTVFLWLTPLILAAVKRAANRWVTSPLLTPMYVMTIPVVFYFFTYAIPELHLDELRRLGWMFPTPESGVPFYHFYTLYDFTAVDWHALAKTIPAMFALTFFGVLHVPINIPALGVHTKEDNMDVNRELIAHGISNGLSGLAGSIQNYLVYTNSCLFFDCGGDSRIAGFLLAIATFGIMIAGPAIIGYIPVMVVGALIFMLGFDLIETALYDTWGKVHRLEYLTILIIVVTMGAWDFVIGILVGIVLACINFVVQTSQKSAVRATYTGQTAISTVRRHPIQQRYLGEAGRQTHVSKLSGYLFFGTIVSVEKRIRELLADKAFEKTPLRFVVFDLIYVTGIDYSASEAFPRIKRILGAKNVQMMMCGVDPNGEIGKSLRSVRLWEGGDVQIFDDLNSALEFCENELLKTFYTRRDALVSLRNARSSSLAVHRLEPVPSSEDFINSPRQSHLHQVAYTTLTEQNDAQSTKWQDFQQPLPLILQTFQGMTEKTEDFWFSVTTYFVRKELSAGAVLYERGDRPTGFYLLEEGIFRASYQVPQGNYYESIVAGTTCGELPFFSQTQRTATVVVERDSIAWLLDEQGWERLQKEHPDVGHELLRISLKLTRERFDAITSNILVTAG